MKKYFILLILLIPFLVSAQIEPDYCNIYFYPHEVNPGDTLMDGPYGTEIRIVDQSLLLWVDLEPGYRFAHKTAYVLISPHGVRVIDGKWWPVLNGKTILYGEAKKYAILSPYEVHSTISTSIRDKYIRIHIYPHELTRADRLVDGPVGRPILIYSPSLLIWVDMLPQALFAHPTAYILISKPKSRVEKGEWWPILNRKRILFGEQNSLGVISPYTLNNYPAIKDSALDE